MANFLYFFPAQNKALQSAADLPANTGLPTILKGCTFDNRGVENNGPGGQNGWLIAPHPTGDGVQSRTGVYLDTQTWMPVEDAEGKQTHWVGWETDNPPRPADVARAKQTTGHMVELGDDHEWIVPVVEAFVPNKEIPHTQWERVSGFITLPQTMTLDAKGDVTMKVKPGHEELADEAGWWVDTFWQSKDYLYARYATFAIRLLAVNYCVGRAEVNALGLLEKSYAVAQKVIMAAIGATDLIAQMDAQKKT